MQKEWNWKDLYDQHVVSSIKDRVTGVLTRFLRMFILIGVLTYFFSFGIAPTGSMIPTIQINDMMLFKKTQNVKPGDIVFFKYPLDETQRYLKRVIAVEGDVVEVTGGMVYVNGFALEEPYLNEVPHYDMEKFTVEKNQYFLLGDNRNNSFDSHEFGTVNKEKIEGKVIAVILPFNRIHLLFFRNVFI